MYTPYLHASGSGFSSHLAMLSFFGKRKVVHNKGKPHGKVCSEDVVGNLFDDLFLKAGVVGKWSGKRR